MTTVRQVDQDISDFVSRLERSFAELHGDGDGAEANRFVDKAGRAILRRNAGKTLREARRAEAVFFGLNPPEVWQDGRRDEYECAFLVATLYCSLKGRRGRQLAAELRYLEQDGFSKESLKRRMSHLLDCWRAEELAFRFRQITKLLASKKRGLDWRQLFKDLRDWHHPDRFVQRRWADMFFRVTEAKNDELKGNPQ